MIPTTLFVTLGLSIAMLITLSSQTTQVAAMSENDPIKWQWTCRSTGYYAMTIFPNGTYKPAAEADPRESQIIIDIKEHPDAFVDPKTTFENRFGSHLYWELEGTGWSEIWNYRSNRGGDASKMEFDGPSTIYEAWAVDGHVK
jgi:hypothetical protein